MITRKVYFDYTHSKMRPHISKEIASITSVQNVHYDLLFGSSLERGFEVSNRHPLVKGTCMDDTL